MAEVEDPAVAAATPTTNTESEGATTDDDVHLSPTYVCRGHGGGSDRIKLRCSFGGRIIPRPSDGALKYVGGETRVLAVPRSIPFRELKKKVEEMFKTEVAAIKYQLLSLSEDLDLDVLISVTCDDDLAHMLDEYDRLEMKRSPTTSPRFRVYVFAPQTATSPRPAAVAPASSSRYAAGGFSRQHHPHQYQHLHHHRFQPEERYVATVPGTPSGLSPPYPSHGGTMSAGNSPRASAMAAESPMFEPLVGRGGMQRVRSSPNLGSLVDAATQHLHPRNAGEMYGGLGGYGVSSSPRHAGAGPFVVHSSSGHHYLQQYAPAPAHVPHPAGSAGRYVHRAGNYFAPPMVPVSRSPDRPFSRGGPVPHGGEMQTPKKAALVWD